MWQHIYYTSSNIFTTLPFESNIFASPALDVYPFLSLLQTDGGRGSSEEMEKRMFCELETMRKTINSPNLISSYGSVFINNEVWIFMEMMDTSLEKMVEMMLMKEEQMPEWVVAHIASAVTRALHHIHQMPGRVTSSCNVKPSNILLSRAGKIKLSHCDTPLRILHLVYGHIQHPTKIYIAPERINPNKHADHRKNDFWSLGISLIEAATGVYPYSAGTVFEQLTQVTFTIVRLLLL